MLATPLLGRPAAPDEIAQAELMVDGGLSVELKDFFSASNGWLQVGFDSTDLRVLSVGELRSGLSTIDSAYRSDLAEYFSSEDPIHPVFRSENFKNLMLLSEPANDGCYFAVPGAHWRFGVIRFHSDQVGFDSFESLMKYERQMCTYFLRGNI